MEIYSIDRTGTVLLSFSKPMSFRNSSAEIDVQDNLLFNETDFEVFVYSSIDDDSTEGQLPTNFTWYLQDVKESQIVFQFIFENPLQISAYAPD